MKFIHKKQITIMGKIQVGQKRPKTVDMGGFTIASMEATEKNDEARVEKAPVVAAEAKQPNEDVVNTADIGDKIAERSNDDTDYGTDVSGDTAAHPDLDEILERKSGRPKKSGE